MDNRRTVIQPRYFYQQFSAGGREFRDRIRLSLPTSVQRQRYILEKHTSMQKHEPKRVLAVVSDLFFSVKLSEAAKRMGWRWSL